MAAKVGDAKAGDARTVPRSTGGGADTLLEVEGLRTYFFTRQGLVKAVEQVSFSLKKSETLAINLVGDGIRDALDPRQR